MASVACVAVDELYRDMMLGSLAGDDTIIIVTTSEQQSKLLTESLTKLL
jgi:arginine repressor